MLHLCGLNLGALNVKLNLNSKPYTLLQRVVNNSNLVHSIGVYGVLGMYSCGFVMEGLGGFGA